MDTLQELMSQYSKVVKSQMTFYPCFKYWQKELLEYSTRLFSYEGLPDSIPAHEIDLIAYMGGYCPLVYVADGGRGVWIAAYSSGMFEQTDYLDMFKKVNFATPLHFGERTIDKTAVIVPNNSLKTPLIWRINHYATLLAHCDVSIVAELVNDREQDVMEAINSSGAEAAKEVFKKRYDGIPQAIVNKGFSIFKHNFVAARSQEQSSKLWELRNNILSGFLEEIGVKKSFDKKERQITNEVQADDKMLNLNITDMLECRQKAFDKFNELTGNNVKVSCNIDYLLNDNKEGVDIDAKIQ